MITSAPPAAPPLVPKTKTTVVPQPRAIPQARASHRASYRPSWRADPQAVCAPHEAGCNALPSLRTLAFATEQLVVVVAALVAVEHTGNASQLANEVEEGTDAHAHESTMEANATNPASFPSDYGYDLGRRGASVFVIHDQSSRNPYRPCGDVHESVHWREHPAEREAEDQIHRAHAATCQMARDGYPMCDRPLGSTYCAHTPLVLVAHLPRYG